MASLQFSVKTSRPVNTGWDAIPRHFGKCAERYERKRDAAFLGRAVCAKCPDEYQKRALIGDARVIDISKSDGPSEVLLGVKQRASRCRDTKAHYNILVKLTPFETEDVLRKRPCRSPSSSPPSLSSFKACSSEAGSERDNGPRRIRLLVQGLEPGAREIVEPIS